MLGVCGVWGRDEFGVIGMRGVNGLAAGLSTNFLTLTFALSPDSLLGVEGTDGGCACCGGVTDGCAGTGDGVLIG